MRYLLGLLLLIIGATALRAQPITEPADNRDPNDALKAHIGLIARPGRDSVILRWAPSKPGIWLIGNRTGYRVERAVVGSNGRPGAFKPLADSAVMPWPYERWLSYYDANPEKEGSDSADYVAIAYALLNQFGEDAPARDSYSQDDARSIAERRQELETRFSFAMYSVDRSAAAAEGLGLRFVDRNVTPGAGYAYRVYLAGNPGAFLPDTGVVVVTASPAKEGAHPAIIAAGGERQVLLRWKANRYYSSYYVERSEDNGASFRRMNAVPLITLRPSPPGEDDEEIFLDSTAINYRPYRYRVSGTTPFADLESLGDVRGMARDATPPAKPFLPNPEHISARRVNVRWEPGAPATPDLAGFRVWRGGTDSGPFDRLTRALLPPSTREIIDSTFQPDGPNYYLVEAVDTAGNISRSNSAYVALIDSAPPGAPRWIDGRMDSNGVVTLRLHANPERDLIGYRLLRANAPDHEFSVVRESFGDTTTATDTLYHDTVEIRTLTRWTYYRAVALDRNFNESGFSQVLAIPRPDLIPPVAPVITDVFVTDSSVRILYAASSSEDLAYHTIYRRADEKKEWDSIARTSRRDTLFLDRDVKMNTSYQYALRAIDSSGLRSELSSSVAARPYDPGVRPGITRLTAAADSVRKQVILRWEYGGLTEEHWFVVYRGGEDGKLRQYARITSRERMFTDAQPAGSETTYAVRVVTPYGAQSALGEKVRAR